MTKTALNLTLLALILIMAQAVVFNNVSLFGVAVPFVFIYVIIKLPITLATAWVMTIGFFMGLTVDMFADTYGMNALAATLLTAIRKPVLRLYLPRGEELADPVPSLRTPGPGIFAKYLTTMTLFYCTAICLIEAFTFFNPLRLIVRILASTALSAILMLALDSLLSQPKFANGKRL